MDNSRLVIVAIGAAALGWLAHPQYARSADPAPATQISTPVVDYTAQCFVDSATERRYCERRADVARLVDCTDADTVLQCRMEYMQLMGKSGWTLVRVGGGTFREWWEAPLFFYERTSMRTGPVAE